MYRASILVLRAGRTNTVYPLMIPFLISEGTLAHFTVQLVEVMFVNVILLGGAPGTEITSLGTKVNNLVLDRNTNLQINTSNGRSGTWSAPQPQCFTVFYLYCSHIIVMLSVHTESSSSGGSKDGRVHIIKISHSFYCL